MSNCKAPIGPRVIAVIDPALFSTGFMNGLIVCSPSIAASWCWWEGVERVDASETRILQERRVMRVMRDLLHVHI